MTLGTKILKNMKKTLAIFTFVLLTFNFIAAQEIVKGDIVLKEKQGSYTPSFENDKTGHAPKNIILLIGDGMGLAHISAAMFANGNELTITNLKTCGFVRTQAAGNDFTTDSGASGTAYATGFKTHNGAIGVDVDNKPLKNIPEIITGLGYVSGVVTTDDIDGCTPSVFFAHRADRHMSEGIWEDLADAKLSFIAGGSNESFEKQSYETRDAIEKRFKVVSSLDNAVRDNRRIAYLPEKDEVASIAKGRGNFLPETTQYAIDFLNNHPDNRNGFFLMVEGARIDKSSHDNDFETAILELLDFDKAVEAAIRFAEKDGNTLVIISADHETGAVTLRGKDNKTGAIKGQFVSKGHTPIMVPLFAYGPMSELFACVQENSDVNHKIVSLFKENTSAGDKRTADMKKGKRQ